ncbi:MAG: hypothetical protein IJJ33_14315, partial [Victivallales bacterium]|nr:hypothetical protein [Victivallales bacterium]
ELTFYPIGPMPKGKELPDRGVKSATIDLRHFFPGATFASVTVEGGNLDGAYLPFAAQADDGKVTIRPADGHYNYRIRF